MKVQEVILKAMAGSLKWWEAAEIIGVSDRTMRRWRERYQERGYDGLYDRRKRRPSPRRVPLKTAEEVLRLYRETDFDLLHIDASKHAWFGDGRYYDLITILDDATSEIY